MTFETSYIEEPDLIFGGFREEKDPRQGLSSFGPYHYADEELLSNIKVGIVGNKLMIDKTIEILKLIQIKIDSQEPNKWLYRHFPGVSMDSPFKCTLSHPSTFQERLSDDYDISKVQTIDNVNERIAYGVDLYVKKIAEIKTNDDLPHVIICGLPTLIEEYCGISERTRGAKQARLSSTEIERQQLIEQGQQFLSQWGLDISSPLSSHTAEENKEKSYDFRNALKGKAMEFGIPVQLLRQSTANHVLAYQDAARKVRQDPSSFAWNFSTALYYKANGKPWRLAKLRNDTCYVGISFFYDKLNYRNDIQISMAQVFTHSGEGLVLRGTEVIVDEHTKQAYLSQRQAKDLLTGALALYTEKAKRNPSRVVLHKSSPFSTEERSGFNEAIYSIGSLMKDFVAIKSFGVHINFLRMGRYPVLRGMLVKLTDNEYLLYSSGYIPRLRTYPGHRIPNPLKIIHEGDSSTEEIAKEILGLTKLNWNTTAFSTSLPITLEFAHGVGKVLSELPKDKPIQNHYKFYM